MKKKEKKDALLTSINKNKKCHSEHQGLTHYTYFLSIESRKIEINSSKIPKEIQQPEIAEWRKEVEILTVTLPSKDSQIGKDETESDWATDGADDSLYYKGETKRRFYSQILFSSEVFKTVWDCN